MKNFIAAILLTGTVQLMAQIPAGYYDPAQGLSGDALKAALNSVIDGHIEYPYTSSSTDVWDILKEADRDPNNAENVLCIYSRFSIPAAPEYNNAQGWNREHVWAKSRGNFGTDRGAGTDAHHLRAADVSTNSARSNRAFAVSTKPYVDAGGTYNGATPSFTSTEAFTWMPPENVRGDVARMIFYMATRYEGASGEPDLELTEEILGNTDKTPFHGKLSDLLDWHEADPVDAAEQKRNEIVYGFQNNRNPFIDHPEYVGFIWGPATLPSFNSDPETLAVENSSYSYSITATGGQNSLTISATSKPDWLTFNDNGNGSATLSGTPSSSDVGGHSVALIVTDGIDSETQNFTITVSASTGGNVPSALIFSEYIEGASFNKAIEIANFTGATVNLAGYVIKKQTNGAGDWNTGLALSGSIITGDVYVIAHASAESSILSEADLATASTSMNFNGNDPLGLFKDDVLIDIIGTLGVGADFAKDVILVRNPDITEPKSTYSTEEWKVESKEDFSFLGKHTINVSAPNLAPSVSISSPTAGATFSVGDEVTISATASDSDGSISSIEFFVNGSSIGVDTSAPYSASFAIGDGSFSITTIATDDQSTSTTSSGLNIAGLIPLNVREIASFEEIRLYPNPLSIVDNLKIDYDKNEEVILKIIDMNGKEFLQAKKRFSIGENEIPIDLTPLKPGVYFVEMKSETSRSVKKFQIK